MLQGINSTETALDINLQELGDQILGLFGDTVPDLALELPDAALDLLDNSILSTSVEGRATAQHDVENDTDRPQVTLFVVTAREDFRRNVIRGTIHLAHLVRVLFAVMMRGTKVDDLD